MDFLFKDNMEIKPYNNGFAVYRNGTWCTWCETIEWAEIRAKEYANLEVK